MPSRPNRWPNQYPGDIDVVQVPFGEVGMVGPEVAEAERRLSYSTVVDTTAPPASAPLSSMVKVKCRSKSPGGRSQRMLLPLTKALIAAIVPVSMMELDPEPLTVTPPADVAFRTSPRRGDVTVTVSQGIDVLVGEAVDEYDVAGFGRGGEMMIAGGVDVGRIRRRR